MPKSKLRHRTEATRQALASRSFQRSLPVARPPRPQAIDDAAGPTVVNRHHYRGKRMPEPWLYIGRNDRQPSKASPLRNPFDVRKHGAEAMDLYREHLRRQVEDGDAVILAELRKITANTHLVCSCAPRPCHGDVVVEVWLELAGSGRLAAR